MGPKNKAIVGLCIQSSLLYPNHCSDDVYKICNFYQDHIRSLALPPTLNPGSHMTIVINRKQSHSRSSLHTISEMRGVKGTISLTPGLGIPAGGGAAATAGLCPTRPEEAGCVQPPFSAPEHAAKSLAKPAQNILLF